MILVDTSSWIHMLRPSGDPVVRGRVETALTNGQACWCPLVQLELWNGARGDASTAFCASLPGPFLNFRSTTRVWHAAYGLARRARAAGVTVPATDVIILSCARRHGAAIETLMRISSFSSRWIDREGSDRRAAQHRIIRQSRMIRAACSGWSAVNKRQVRVHEYFGGIAALGCGKWVSAGRTKRTL